MKSLICNNYIINLSLLLSFIFLFISCKNSTTNIKIGSEIVDVGIIKKTELKEAKFALKNIGNNDLMIKSLTPDCICTKVRASHNVVIPGDTLYIYAVYNNTVIGPFQQLIFLELNTTDKKIILILKGKVIG